MSCCVCVEFILWSLVCFCWLWLVISNTMLYEASNVYDFMLLLVIYSEQYYCHLVITYGTGHCLLVAYNYYLATLTLS